MAIFVQASGYLDSGTTVTVDGTTGQPSAWSTPTSGNLLIALITSGAGSPSMPSGWTQRYTAGSGGTLRHVYDKVSDGSETSITFTSSSSEDHMLTVFEFDTSATFDVAAGAQGTSVTSVASGSTGTLGSATSFAVVQTHHWSASDTSFNSGFTLDGDYDSGNNGSLYYHGFGHKILSATTALNVTGSWTGSSEGQTVLAVYGEVSSQDISPGLVSNLGTAQDPSLSTGAVDINPGLLTNLITDLSPTLSPGGVTISPARVSRLVTKYDPKAGIKVHPSVVEQLSDGPSPALTYQYEINPDFPQQVVVSYAPVLAPGAVNISVELLSQLIAISDPVISQGIVIIIGLANQLIVSYDPTIAQGAGSSQNIGPTLLQQITSAYDPELTPGVVAIYPDLLEVLVAGPGPNMGGDDQPSALTIMSDWSG